MKPQEIIPISIEKINVDSERSVKLEDHEIYHKLEECIKKYGQLYNIIVRDLGEDKYELVNGLYVLKILQSLNYEAVNCINLGTISKEDAEVIMLSSNTSFDKDIYKLAVKFQELTKTKIPEDIALTSPYFKMEIEKFHRILEFDFSRYLIRENVYSEDFF